MRYGGFGKVVLVALAGGWLGACQFADETLWPEKPPPGIEPRVQAAPAAEDEAAPDAADAPDPAGRLEPLMVIRSDRDDVAFEAPLGQTVEQVLGLRPEARFDLVAVSPGRGTETELARAGERTRRQAEKVLRYLATDLGLAPERISLSATTNLGASAGEVHIYLR